MNILNDSETKRSILRSWLEKTLNDNTVEEVFVVFLDFGETDAGLVTVKRLAGTYETISIRNNYAMVDEFFGDFIQTERDSIVYAVPINILVPVTDVSNHDMIKTAFEEFQSKVIGEVWEYQGLTFLTTVNELEVEQSEELLKDVIHLTYTLTITITVLGDAYGQNQVHTLIGLPEETPTRFTVLQRDVSMALPSQGAQVSLSEVATHINTSAVYKQTLSLIVRNDPNFFKLFIQPLEDVASSPMNQIYTVVSRYTKVLTTEDEEAKTVDFPRPMLVESIATRGGIGNFIFLSITFIDASDVL